MVNLVVNKNFYSVHRDVLNLQNLQEEKYLFLLYVWNDVMMILQNTFAKKKK